MKKQFILLLSLIIILSGCSSIAIMPEKVINEPLNDNKIHTGEMYAAKTQVNVNAGQTVYIKANSTNQTHLIKRFVYGVTTGNVLDYTIELYEGGTDTGGVLIEEFNVNRVFNETTSPLNIYNNVTGVDLTNSEELPFGTKLISDKKSSAGVRTDIEYILSPNKNYYLAITNNDGGVMTLDFWWEWYTE